MICMDIECQRFAHGPSEYSTWLVWDNETGQRIYSGPRETARMVAQWLRAINNACAF